MPTTGRGTDLPAIALLCAAAFMAAWSQDHPLVCAALIVGVIVFSGRLPHLRAPDAMALVVAAWAGATTIWSLDHGASARATLNYASAALLFVATRHVVVRMSSVLTVAACYLTGCLVRARDVITQASTGDLPQRTDALDLTVRFGVEGINFNFTAYTLVTGALMASLLLTVGGQARLTKLLTLAPLPVLAWGVLLNGTKGALVALLLVPVYLAVSKVLPRVALAVAAVGVPALLVLVPLGLGQDILLGFDSGFGQRTTGDLSGRLLIWPDAAASWSDSLLLGIGVGAYPLVNPLGVGAHSLLLTVGNDLGLVGLLGYVAVFALALGAYARGFPPARRRAGLFVVTLSPIWLTGHWEVALGAWLTLGLLTALPTGRSATSTGAGRHRRRRDGQRWRTAAVSVAGRTTA
ncbi:O-antigen ligase family protein [Micromonospora sp. NPDC000018]|uniref:O-antigen ligase family protein n=1 Tax=Micromonospora sp. NPDC000018 TaxID=3154239 RepID=UPI00332E781C